MISHFAIQNINIQKYLSTKIINILNKFFSYMPGAKNKIKNSIILLKYFNYNKIIISY